MVIVGDQLMTGCGSDSSGGIRSILIRYWLSTTLSRLRSIGRVNAVRSKINEKYGPIQYKKKFKHGEFLYAAAEPDQTEDGQARLHASSQLKRLEAGELFQRCFAAIIMKSAMSATGSIFLQLLHEAGDSDALVVNVVDIFDFNGSDSSLASTHVLLRERSSFGWE